LADYRKYILKAIDPLAISTKFPHWLQQKTIVNGIETFWPPHLSSLVWLRAACTSKRLVWHYKTTDSTPPPSHNLSQIWWSLPPVRVWRHLWTTLYQLVSLSKAINVRSFLTIYFLVALSNVLLAHLLRSRSVTSLRQQEGRRVSWEGPKFF